MPRGRSRVAVFGVFAVFGVGCSGKILWPSHQQRAAERKRKRSAAAAADAAHANDVDGGDGGDGDGDGGSVCRIAASLELQ